MLFLSETALTSLDLLLKLHPLILGLQLHLLLIQPNNEEAYPIAHQHICLKLQCL